MTPISTRPSSTKATPNNPPTTPTYGSLQSPPPTPPPNLSPVPKPPNLRVELEEEVAHCQRHVLEEGVLDEVGQAVAGLLPVHKYEARQELELGDGVVGGVDCGAALLAGDSDANFGFLDHGHVIGAVADGQHLAL